MTAIFILTYVVAHMIHVQHTDGRGIVPEGKKTRGILTGVAKRQEQNHWDCTQKTEGHCLGKRK